MMDSGEVYDLSKLTVIVYIKKTTPDFSIVKRLGGSGAAKIGILFIPTKHL